MLFFASNPASFSCCNRVIKLCSMSFDICQLTCTSALFRTAYLDFAYYNNEKTRL